MEPVGIVSQWSIWFPDCPPFRPIMRGFLHARWLKVHSLPDAKRYPTTNKERSELLRRHAAVSTSMLGEGAPCAIVLGYANGYQGQNEPASVQRLGVTVIRGWGREWAEDERLADDDMEAMTFAGASCIWRRGQFDDVILDVAEDRTAPLLFLALRTGRVYSQYDGGADLFAENEGARDALRVEFSEWTSTREDGL